MSDSVGPKLSKWPFFLGDLLLIGLSVLLVLRGPATLTLWQAGVCLVALVSGAWLCATPFLRDHSAALKLTEVDSLATAVAQLQNLEQIKTQILSATGHWQTVQDHSTQAVTAAREVADRMKGELSEFCAFLKKANDAEKNHLRLEVEKLRRGEGEWIQVVVHMLDHVFVLHKAAANSGQPGVAAQMEQFQFACRDIARRVGLVAFTPTAGEVFDAQAHQLAESDTPPPSEAHISETIGPGFTYQGQLVRRALVRLEATKAF